MEPPIEISHSDVGDWTVVEIRGEVDVYTVPTIKQFVIERLADGVRRFPRGDREKRQTLGRRLRRHRLRPSHHHAAPTSFPRGGVPPGGPVFSPHSAASANPA
ncbi:STAS domain-containing protein [Streptomyces salinarius]|uniref:hypothetical protein n=1 Tax=Streptomyces salinarius TaxID=2762598 RepID=UPI001F09DD63|nr:hypothetical protein [Streptomyces salinarius]